MNEIIKFIVVSLILSFQSLALAKNSLTIGIFNEHEIYIETSAPYAIGWKLLTVAAARENIELETIRETWTRSLSALDSEQFDGVYGAMITTERLKWGRFSVPLSYDEIHIFAQPDNPVESKEQINKSTDAVGVTKDSIQHDMARELDFSNIYAIVDRSSLYKMLLAGRLDYLIYSDTFINTYCFGYHKKKEENCLKSVGKPLSINSIHVLYKKGNLSAQPLADRIDQQIGQLYESKYVESLFKQYPLGDRLYNTWENLYKTARSQQSLY